MENSLTKLNEILNRAEILPFHDFPPEKFSGKFHENKNKTLERFYMSLNDIIEFQECVEKLLKYKGLDNTYTTKTFEEKIEELLYQLKVSNQKLNKAHIDSIYEEMLNVEIEECAVIHKVHGVEFNGIKEYDNFFIGDYENTLEQINKKYKADDLKSFLCNISMEEQSFESDTFIVMFVKAREEIKAKELAQEKMKKIEAALRIFAFSISSIYNVEIFDCKDTKTDYTTIVSEKMLTGMIDMPEFKHNVQLDELYNRFGKYLDELIKIMFKNNSSEMEKNIIQAVLFCSRAVHNCANTTGFWEIMVAIEALLQPSGSGLVTPSITYQISEYCAFILCSTTQDRLNMVKIMKELYKTRSNITHGNGEDVSERAFKQLFYIAVNLIVKFLADEHLRKIKKAEDLKNYIDNIKFSAEVQPNA